MKQSYNTPVNELIDKAAGALKKVKEIKPPAWAGYVKTGVSKERPPVKKDWWYARAASILKKVSRLGPIGTSKLRTKYGSKKNRGVRPGKFYRGSGNIIRKILQQLETAGLVIKKDKGVHKGKVITAKGKELLFGK